MIKLLAAVSLSVTALGAHADSVDTLKDFIRDVKTGRAQFTQTVTSPDGSSRPSSPMARRSGSTTPT
jgi:outer membrane lipoprotein carrier protein